MANSSSTFGYGFDIFPLLLFMFGYKEAVRPRFSCKRNFKLQIRLVKSIIYKQHWIYNMLTIDSKMYFISKIKHGLFGVLQGCAMKFNCLIKLMCFFDFVEFKQHIVLYNTLQWFPVYPSRGPQARTLPARDL